MKKVILVSVVCFLTLISCKKEEDSLTNLKKETFYFKVESVSLDSVMVESTQIKTMTIQRSY